MWLKIRLLSTTLIAVLCAVALSVGVCNAAIVYVRPGGNDANTGSSWAFAYKTIQKAAYKASAGDDVWVAEGTYPDGVGVKAGVSLYGGFTGTESMREQRDPRAHPTVLQRPFGATTYAFYFYTGVTSSTVVDGFTINGWPVCCKNTSPTISNNVLNIRSSTDNCIICQSSSAVITGNAFYCPGMNPVGNGAAISCTGGSPTIRDDSFTGYFGMGVKCQDSSAIIEGNRILGVSGWGISCSGAATVTIRHNTIAGCIATTNSIAESVIACSDCTALIEGNRITGNLTFGQFGRYYLIGTYSCDAIALTNCSGAVRGNVIAIQSGSGVSCVSSNVLVVNNTLVSNGTGIKLSLSSGIIANNIVAFGAQGITSEGGTPTLLNNCVFGNSGPAYTGVTPGAASIAADPRFASMELGDFHVLSGSPCLDSGDNSQVPDGTLDMDGAPRVYGKSVDIGADEYDGAEPVVRRAVIRVSPSGSDDNDGSSWALAKRTIGAALLALSAGTGGEVWVAAGDYQDEDVVLPPFAYLYGGFVGNESHASARDPRRNVPVIRTAQILCGHGVSAIEGFRVVGLASTQFEFPAGIFCRDSSPRIAANTVRLNARYGIQCSGTCAAMVTGNTVQGATASIMVENCVGGPRITGNRVLSGITGISANDSVTADTLISGNVVTGCQTGLSCRGAGCRVVNNTVVANSNGIVVTTATQLVANNISAFNSQGMVGESSASHTIRNNCVYGNTSRNYSKTDLTGIDGNVSADLLLVDWRGGECHLLTTSPCVNGGLNSVAELLAQDMDGQTRIQGGTVDIGADELWPLPSRLGADGSSATLKGALVHSVFGDGSFYIQADDRAWGIRVEGGASGAVPANRVDVAGTLATTDDGERCIRASSVTLAGLGKLWPLSVSLRDLCGADTDCDAALGTGQRGVVSGRGLSTIGLLVKVCGRVTGVDAATGAFFIDDGSVPVPAVGETAGVMVLPFEGLPYGVQPGVWVAVTGASSCRRLDAELRPLVRARLMEDVQVLAP